MAKKRPAAKPAADKRNTEVEISRIQIVENDRSLFEQQDLAELAESIKRFGVLQPVLLRDRNDGTFDLIAGERRLRASKLAKLTTIPATFASKAADDDGAAAEMRLEENVKRVDLNPIERARAIERLVAKYGRDRKAVAELLGVSQSQVSNEMRMLKLPETPWQDWIAAGRISPSAARPLIAWVDFPDVLQWIVDRCSAEIDDGSKHVTERLIQQAVLASSRPLRMVTHVPGTKPSRSDCHFDYQDTPAERKKLRVKKVAGDFGEEPRAFDVAAWDLENADPYYRRLKAYKAEQKKAERQAEKDSTTRFESAGVSSTGELSEKELGRWKDPKSPAAIAGYALELALIRDFLPVLVFHLRNSKPTPDENPAAALLFLLHIDPDSVQSLTDLENAAAVLEYRRALAGGDAGFATWSRDFLGVILEDLNERLRDGAIDADHSPLLNQFGSLALIAEFLKVELKPPKLSRGLLACLNHAAVREFAKAKLIDQVPELPELLATCSDYDQLVGQLVDLAPTGITVDRVGDLIAAATVKPDPGQPCYAV